MAKKPNLVEAFKVEPAELQPKPDPKPVAPPPEKKRHIGGYFSEADYKRIKYFCIENGMTTQELLTHGLNAVLQMHGHPPIAGKEKS